jgi:hypothetical protein
MSVAEAPARDGLGALALRVCGKGERRSPESPGARADVPRSSWRSPRRAARHAPTTNETTTSQEAMISRKAM